MTRPEPTAAVTAAHRALTVVLTAGVGVATAAEVAGTSSGPLRLARWLHHGVQFLDQPFDIGAPTGCAEPDPVSAGECADVLRELVGVRHLGILNEHRMTGIC